MSNLDLNKEFIPLRIALITVSDTRGYDNDKSGDLLVERIAKAGHQLSTRQIIKDQYDNIVALLQELIDNRQSDCIISTGGTGITGRDVTPEAVRAVLDKEVEGFGEMFRHISFQKIGTSALQSRAVGGVAGHCLIFALPGSPSACRDGWDEILVWQLDNRHRPCNFSELLHRLGINDQK